MQQYISVKNLEKKYSDFMIRDLNFFVEEHSITVFLGINGSGKTTTLKMLLGLVNPDMGEITIVVMYGIFIPSLYLLGYDKAKYVPAVATFLIPYAAVLISKIPFSKANISFNIQSIKSYVLPFLCIMVLCFLWISIKMAERWYKIKEM